MRTDATTPPVRQAGSSSLRSAEEVLSGQSKKGPIARLLPFLGPAFIASVAYMDPGNFATNIQAGAQYGYLLLWVILATNLMAMLLQALSAKLGIATGRNLAELCRDRYPRPIALTMWVVAELVAIATDLAEFIGAALGFSMLFALPLWVGGLLTVLSTFLILTLERFGFRKLEAVITALIAVVAISYLIEMALIHAPWPVVIVHMFRPAFDGTESILLAAGILGATVMPHAIFLHSALTQSRVVTRTDNERKKLYRFELLDVFIAMGIAGIVNAAMLIMAAATFNSHGMQGVGEIEEAYRTLTPLLGPAASTVFAISLLAAGLSSSSVGTMAGQVIMGGFLKRQFPVWVRRLVTVAPPMAIILTGLDPTRSLVLSQVVLSFGLPFAVVPLVLFTSDKNLMGTLVNRRITTIVSSLIAVLILALNAFLAFRLLGGG